MSDGFRQGGVEVGERWRDILVQRSMCRLGCSVGIKREIANESWTAGQGSDHEA